MKMTYKIEYVASSQKHLDWMNVLNAYEAQHATGHREGSRHPRPSGRLPSVLPALHFPSMVSGTDLLQEIPPTGYRPEGSFIEGPATSLTILYVSFLSSFSSSFLPLNIEGSRLRPWILLYRLPLFCNVSSLIALSTIHTWEETPTTYLYPELALKR